MHKLLERDIEKYLILKVKELGGEIRKVSWIGRAHAPDRLVMFNGSWFVEMKAPGEEPRPGQTREFARMERHGVPVYVLSTIEQVDEFIEGLPREVHAAPIPRTHNRLHTK